MNPLEGEAIASANNFELMFSTEQTCYFKDEKMRELDTEIGDINSEIADIEIEIIMELMNRVKEHEKNLKNCDLWISHLDWYL